MTNIPNEILAEFPEHTARISDLKTNNAHFSRLYEDYYEVNKAIHRAETDIEPTSDDHLAEMRKERLLLKDQIYKMLVEE